MFGIPNFDLLTDSGKQSFVEYIVNLIRKEIVSYAPSYTGASADLTGYVRQNTDYLLFNSNPINVTPAVAQLNWDDTAGTLEFGLKGGNVVLKIGQESVARVKHADNSGLTKGLAVYVAGSDGANKTVRYAQANTDATSARTFGIMAETVTGGNKAFCCTQGYVENINTIALTEGAPVWLSPSVAGNLTSTKPVAPNHLVLMGFCVKSHATNGIIFVHVVNGFEIDELHDVLITSPTNNDILVYNSGGPYWQNQAAATFAAQIVPPGAITAYAGVSLPTGWLWCNGTTVTSASYPALYNALTNNGASFPYGGSAGSTFTPDLRGRVGVGPDTLGGAADAARLDWANNLGTTGGSQYHTLLTTEIPAHNHTFNTNTDNANHSHGANSNTGDNNASHSHSGNTGNVSSDHAHNAFARTNGYGGDFNGTGVGPHNGSFRNNVGTSGIFANHTHSFNTNNQSANHSHSIAAANAGHSHSGTTANTGGGGAHNTMQPSILVNYIIKT